MSDDASRHVCAFCAVNIASAPAYESAYVTESWRVTAHKNPIEGWMLLIPRRHMESLSDLDDAEAAELGPLLRDASAVQVREFGAEKSYVLQFAEGVRHAHFSIVPRRADLPTDRVGAAVGAYGADPALTSDERLSIADRIRAAWPT